MWLVISTVFENEGLIKVTAQQAVTYTVNAVIYQKRCEVEMLLPT